MLRVKDGSIKFGKPSSHSEDSLKSVMLVSANSSFTFFFGDVRFANVFRVPYRSWFNLSMSC